MLLRMPLRLKLFVCFVPLVGLMIAVTGVYSYRTAASEVVEKTRVAQQDLASEIASSLGFVAQSTFDFSNFLFLLPEVRRFMRTTDPAEMDVAKKEAYSAIAISMVTNRFFQVVLYGEDRELAIDQAGVAGVKPFSFFRDSDWYRMVSAKDKPVWTVVFPEHNPFGGRGGPSLVFARKFKDSFSLRTLGVLLIVVDESRFRAQYEKYAHQQARIYVLGDGDLVLTASDASEIGRLFDPAALADTYVWTETTSETTGWRVVVAQPKDVLLRELNQIQVFTALFAVACAGLSAAAVWVVSGLVTRPLKKLLQSMKRVQLGDFSQQVDIAGNDEIARLGRVYNLMIDRIRHLIEEVYETRLRRREAELRSLQAQINPHFLYNTLNMIGLSAKKYGADDIVEIIQALSNLFRLNLNDGRDFVTVAQEMELVGHYLSIQRLRFADRLDYAIEVDPACANVVIPKMTVQPFVENAVVHGIEPMNEGGFIGVRAVRDGDRVRIEVSDNGVGIPADRLAEIRGGGRPKKGYAFANVRERLALAYGPEARIDIDSREHVGTQVVIDLPLLERGKGEWHDVQDADR
ncbi:MAG: hypothetical protein BLM47_09790 [Candidatus Reconcilbacillus cellulovorans]|uniref:histidine kinase n=1 Tax=Candidatus Reconcilbacillus cellulovorans TaxID=1906605 RepID=A0A2A6DZF1_9BACL|nr:MAG: hypothetical protein BLM47_09790 [Candidatus Reconcilbacillus cellulovorans]